MHTRKKKKIITNNNINEEVQNELISVVHRMSSLVRVKQLIDIHKNECHFLYSMAWMYADFKKTELAQKYINLVIHKSIFLNTHLISYFNAWIALATNATTEANTDITGLIVQSKWLHQNKSDQEIALMVTEIEENELVPILLLQQSLADMYGVKSEIYHRMNKFQSSLSVIDKEMAIRRKYTQLEIQSGLGLGAKDAADPRPSWHAFNKVDIDIEMGMDIRKMAAKAPSQSPLTESAAVNIGAEMDIDINVELERLATLVGIQEMLDDRNDASNAWLALSTKQKTAVFVDRELFDCYAALHMTYSNLHDFETSFMYAERCVVLEPFNVGAWNNRAFANFECGRYQQCMDECNYALLKFEQLSKRQCAVKNKVDFTAFDKALLIGNRGLAEYKLGFYDSATRDLNACIRAVPQSSYGRKYLKIIWDEVSLAIYEGLKNGCLCNLEEVARAIVVPMEICCIIADYSVGNDFQQLDICHASSIVW